MAENKEISQMTDEEILKEMEGLHYDMCCEAHPAFISAMESYYDELEKELNRRGNGR